MTTQLAAQARTVYGVPAFKSIEETIRFLESFGAELLPFHQHWTGFSMSMSILNSCQLY